MNTYDVRDYMPEDTPCPFCGQRFHKMETSANEREFRVCCAISRCGASGPWRLSPESAARAWQFISDKIHHRETVRL